MTADTQDPAARTRQEAAEPRARTPSLPRAVPWPPECGALV